MAGAHRRHAPAVVGSARSGTPLGLEPARGIEPRTFRLQDSRLVPGVAYGPALAQPGPVCRASGAPRPLTFAARFAATLLITVVTPRRERGRDGSTSITKPLGTTSDPGHVPQSRRAELPPLSGPASTPLEAASAATRPPTGGKRAHSQLALHPWGDLGFTEVAHTVAVPAPADVYSVSRSQPSCPLCKSSIDPVSTLVIIRRATTG